MSGDLFRQVRRVEAQAERGFEGTAAESAERRRRLRLELLRQHLSQNVDFLKAAHIGGASGQQSVQAYAAFMDGFLSTLFRLAVEDAKKEGATPSPIVLVALGGYGRGELGPLSDLDLMVIYDDEMVPYVQRATQGLLYTLWDLGLTVGHSVRSLTDCVAIARTDFASRTSMQEARYVVGDRGRPPRSPHRHVAGLDQVRRTYAARPPREGVDHAERGASHRCRPHLPVAGAQRAPLPLRPQERRALARHPAADRQALRLRERRGLPRRREVHAGLLPPRPRHPPRVEPAHRPLPGDALPARHRAPPAAPGGAGRRPGGHGRAHPPRARGRPRPPCRAGPAHEGVLALASPGP